MANGVVLSPPAPAPKNSGFEIFCYKTILLFIFSRAKLKGKYKIKRK